jgi:Metallo-peptidase family M12B Reprolysin-like/FG-GAP-like repeat/Calx-beta domain
MKASQLRGSRGSVAYWVLVAVAALAALILSCGVSRTPPTAQVTDSGPVGRADAGDAYFYIDHDTLFRTANRTSLPDENGLIPHEGNESGNRYVIYVSRRAAEDAAAQKGALAIELPSGERFNVQFEHAERAPNGDWTLVGKVATRLGPQSAVLTFGRAGLFGVLPVPDGGQMQLTTTRGVTLLEPVRPMHPRDAVTGELPVDYVLPQQPVLQPQKMKPGQRIVSPSNTTVVPALRVSANPAGTSLTSSKAAIATVAATEAPAVQIDVLGLYTKNMVELRGSVSAAETESNNYLAIANQAHRDSNTGITFTYVGLRQVDYPADAFNAEVLGDLQSNSMPDGTDIQALRDTLRADLVALHRPYVSGDTNGGIGNLVWASGYEGAAFSVSNLSTYTFAHETGHNLGSMHDIETSTANGVISYGAFEYSFGYRQDGPPKFATIMAYTVNGQPWIGYFSHPGTTDCLNVACGTEGADNARSMRDMALVIAEYRLPLNQILVTGSQVIEGEPGNLWPRQVNVTVKLSSPAPAGGVRFDIATEDGTAVAGSDYSGWFQPGALIPEGESTRSFSVTILPDLQVEAEETFRMVLSNVQGAGIYRDAATIRILDDDPRVAVTGRILAPSGGTLPATALQIGVTEWSGGSYQQASYWAQPPNFEYRAPIQAGSSVQIDVYASAPYANASYDLGVVNGDQYRDLVLKRVVKLTGTLRFAPGQPVPTSSINVIAWGVTGSDSGSGATASPPDFTYTFDVVEGAEVRLDAQNPPAPFVRQQIALGEIWSDRVQDIAVGLVPSLVMTGARVAEGASDQERTINLNMYLSAPAPTGGAQVDVELVNGTAVAGSDFVMKAKTRITIGAGSNAISFPVVVRGDATPESTEWFKVVLSNPSGAWLPSPEAIVYIENDDFGTLHNDFDGDGKSDVFWRNLTDGRNILWWGADYSDQTNPGAVAAQAWAVVGAGDFDGDGQSDLFWRNSANGQNVVWPSGNGDAKRSVTTITGLAWKVVTVGDFNGDGRADIFWRHDTNGQNAIWWSGDYAARSSEQAVTVVWKVAGAGDFDGDGKDDVFWRNTATGANIVWWSGDYSGYTNLTGVTNQAWEVAAIGDYAGDEIADVFWRNRTTGEHIIWWNGSYANQVRETTVSTAWKVVASGDYNGDGKSDLFWRNGTTGANMIWDSGRYATRRNVMGVTNTAWVVQQ